MELLNQQRLPICVWTLIRLRFSVIREGSQKNVTITVLGILSHIYITKFFLFCFFYPLQSYTLQLTYYLIWWHLWVLDHYALHLSPHACPLGIEQTRVLGLLHAHHALVARLLAGHHGLETWWQKTTIREENLGRVVKIDLSKEEKKFGGTHTYTHTHKQYSFFHEGF